MHRNEVCHMSLRVMMKEGLKKQRVGELEVTVHS